MTSYRVLIVEDQREVSRLLHASLDTLEQDIQVVEIPSGEEAILDASRNKTDLLIADYRLPGITGIELMRKIRHHQPAIKVLLITGLTDPKVRAEAAEARVDAFFLKPIPIADFLDAVERNLGLVESHLPAEPIAPPKTEEKVNIADLLAGLRKELKATAVILLNDRGIIQARAGDLPDSSVEVALVSSLLAIYSAGQKISHLTGQKRASSWHIFYNGDYDVIFAPVGLTHAILLIGKKLAAEERTFKTLKAFAAVREPIKKGLGDTSPLPAKAATDEAVTTPLESGEQSAKELEPLLKEARKKLKPKDVDAFWDTAADKLKTPAKSDMLSYEQARQLGLTPEDKP